MIGSLQDNQKFCNQAFENTVPGGWLEMYDVTFPPVLNDGEWPKDSAHLQWYVCLLLNLTSDGTLAALIAIFERG